MCVVKWIAYGIVAFILWLILIIASRQLAYEYVSFLAASFTNSCAFKWKFSCGLFEWDNELKLLSYFSYLAIFTFVAYRAAFVLRSEMPRKVKIIAIIIFALSFPTYTNWGVSSVCGGFGGCSTGYYIGVVVPVIMTADIFTIPSAFVALVVVWAYMRTRRISI